MISRFVTSTVLFLVLLAAGPAWAVNDQFTVGLVVNNDVTSPTTPGPVSVIPVASTQIDIIWGASVDNDVVAGYRVFRDAVQVATTTLTSYSDTGLTPSTTYSYTIQAFDAMANYSSTSAPVATTTLAAPVIPDAPSSTRQVTFNPTKIDPKLTSLNITSGTNEALVAFDTNVYIRYELRWGKTTNYELGAVQSQLFQRVHLTKLTDLEPGTRYQYELRVYNQRGEMHILAQDAFTTADEADTTAPANVGNLVATVVDGDVVLSWSNPTDADFAYVRVVRNYRFYPLDPGAGYVAYQGGANSYTDRDAFRDNDVQYYTVFSYDKKGNVSAGAVVVVYKPASGDGVNPGTGTVGSTTQPTRPVDQLPPPLILQYNLRFSDLSFWQDDHVLDMVDGVVTGTDAWPTRVSLPYDVAPQHLKTILIELTEMPTHQQTFLLRINRDSTGYETRLPQLRPGSYPVTLSVFDYQTNVISRVTGTFVVTAAPVTLIPTAFTISWCWWLLFLLLVILYIAIVRRRRRR